jgi:mRNA interferase RelE/StbE
MISSRRTAPVYELLLERNAERDLKKLPKGMFDRVILNVKALAQNPKPQGSRKIIGSKNDWRIRVGDYRVIYEIDEEVKAVKVMRIRHRREAYR